jgi:glyoxylase-like metal-dependent hydrolase (beta-lactamase superfamily II)
MLNIHFFTFNPFQENTYIISNEKKQCWIIDPGMYGERETKQLIAYIAENKLTPVAIINTHAHIDHILGIDALVDEYHIPFGMHADELPILKMAKPSAEMFGVAIKNEPTPTFFMSEGTPLQLGDDQLELFLTPGHSPGSISFYYPKGSWVVSGDVLFAGSIGRTDLPGGDFDTLISSIRRHLFTLPGDTTVYSGHGGPTTIAEEKKHNPFLKG